MPGSASSNNADNNSESRSMDIAEFSNSSHNAVHHIYDREVEFSGFWLSSHDEDYNSFGRDMDWPEFSPSINDNDAVYHSYGRDTGFLQPLLSSHDADYSSFITDMNSLQHLPDSDNGSNRLLRFLHNTDSPLHGLYLEVYALGPGQNPPFRIQDLKESTHPLRRKTNRPHQPQRQHHDREQGVAGHIASTSHNPEGPSRSSHDTPHASSSGAAMPLTNGTIGQPAGGQVATMPAAGMPGNAFTVNYYQANLPPHISNMAPALVAHPRVNMASVVDGDVGHGDIAFAGASFNDSALALLCRNMDPEGIRLLEQELEDDLFDKFINMPSNDEDDQDTVKSRGGSGDEAGS